MDNVAMIFSSLEWEKAKMILENTYYSFSIFLIGGWIISSVLVKYMIKNNKKNANKHKEEKSS